MKNKIKYLLVALFMFMFVYSEVGAVVVDTNTYKESAIKENRLSIMDIEQNVEWVSNDTIKYSIDANIHARTNLDYAINDWYLSGSYYKGNVTLIIYNIADTMTANQIKRFKAKLQSIRSQLSDRDRNSNIDTYFYIMTEDEYLSFVSEGNSITSKLLTYGSSSSLINDVATKIYNTDTQSKRLVYNINMNDVKTIVPPSFLSSSSRQYSVIHINTFPDFSNVVSVNSNNNEEELDDSFKLIKIKKGGVVYDYNGSSVSDAICIPERIYYLQYVDDASFYNDNLHVDYDNITDMVNNIYLSGCNFLNNTISFKYNDKFFELDSTNDFSASDGKVYVKTDQAGSDYISWDIGSIKSKTKQHFEILLHRKDISDMSNDYCNQDNNCVIESDGRYRIKPIQGLQNAYRYTGDTKYNLITDEVSIENKFNVYYYYDSSPCTIPTENRIQPQYYDIYTPVTIDSNEVYCPGYEFRGWTFPKLPDYVYRLRDSGSEYYHNNVYYNDISKINNDTFLMPAHDVYLIPLWSSVNIEKSYKDKWDGASVNPSSDLVSSYYSGSVYKRLAFGGFCWYMANMDSNGNITLVYDGEPGSSGYCENTRKNHGGASLKTSVNLDDEYYYATNYWYDYELGKFVLKGNLNKATWSDETAESLIGKYTCKSNISIKTCDQMYYIMDYNSESSAYAIEFDNDFHYSEIGISPFNYNSDSIAYTKYAYGTPYKTKYLDTKLRKDILLKTEYSSDYFYGDSINYTNDNYSLSNLNLISDIEDLNNLIGKYTFFKSNIDYASDEVYYIAGVDDSYIYYIQLYDGELKEDIEKTYYFAKNYSTNSSTGEITLDNPVEVKNIDWFTDTLKITEGSDDNYVVCENSSSCTNYFNVYMKSNNELGYFKKILLSDNISYDVNTNKYTLTNPQRKLYVNSDLSDLSQNDNPSKYTCLDEGNSCAEVYYVKDLYPDHAYAVALTGGINYEDALTEMNKPRYDSDVKKIVDAWYKNYLADYSEFLVNPWDNKVDGQDHTGETTFYPISIAGFTPGQNSVSDLLNHYKSTTYYNETWFGNDSYGATNFPEAYALYLKSVDNNKTLNYSNVTLAKSVRPIVVLSSGTTGYIKGTLYVVNDGYEY